MDPGEYSKEDRPLISLDDALEDMEDDFGVATKEEIQHSTTTTAVCNYKIYAISVRLVNDDGGDVCVVIWPCIYGGRTGGRTGLGGGILCFASGQVGATLQMDILVLKKLPHLSPMLATH
ncbi:hypothetical protein ACJX0J_017214 [Zea mays]